MEETSTENQKHQRASKPICSVYTNSDARTSVGQRGGSKKVEGTGNL